MPFFGAHIKTEPLYGDMIETAAKKGANTAAFFIRSPRGGKLKSLKENDISSYQQATQRHGFGPCVAHAPYVYNMASPNQETRKNTVVSLVEDMQRLDTFEANIYYNIHPGAHVGQGTEAGINAIVSSIDEVLQASLHTVLLLETMAGKGTEIGGTFEELARIRALVAQPNRVGVCLDTCHVWDAGYDIVSHLNGVIDLFDDIVGLENLKAIHLNDSKNERGSKKDRHEVLCEGKIGEAALQAILQHRALHDLPFILETPHDEVSHTEQIARMRALYIKKKASAKR